MKPFRSSFAVLLLGGAAAIGGFFGGNSLLEHAQFAIAEEKVQATREQLAKIEDLATVFRHVGKVVEPSVVNINVTKTIAGGPRSMPFDDEMLRRFFPDQNRDGQPDLPEGFPESGDSEGGQRFEQMGTGSGVIMEVENGVGYIVTNNHVAGGAEKLAITLADGRVITEAEVIGTDAKTDLAIIKIQSDRLIPAQWGDSDQLDKGDWIMAFGSPFGYVGSMTHGIVSALNRQAGILGRYGYENFIQVDAPINPGNSGGPLVNIHGEVVGINTAIASRNGGFQGIGFAIPSNQAKEVYDILREKGRVVRGFLGVEIDDVSNPRNPRTRTALESSSYKGESGVFVWGANANTPASGVIQPGDIILSFDGKEVENTQELRSIVANTAPGSQIKVRLFRGDEERTVNLTVGEQPDDRLAAAGSESRDGSARQTNAEALGMKVTTLTEELAGRYGLNDTQDGLIVTNVQRGSPAALAGIRPGDLITRVGSDEVKTPQDLNDILEKLENGKGIVLKITNREGSRLALVQPKEE